MRKEEFISKVEYLLSDISNEEKYDAINYYRDYIEEAGPDKEDEVLAEFGSPERIAAIIRADLMGDLNDGGEFTENGFSDSRFDEPVNSIVAASVPLKEESFNKETFSGDDSKNNQNTNNTSNTNNAKSESGFKNVNKSGKANKDSKDSKNNKGWKIALIVVLLVLLSPVLFGTGTFLLATLGSFVGIIVFILFAIALVTAGLIIGGVVLLFTAFGFLFVNGAIAAILFGVAAMAIGLGLLALVLSVLFYGKFIPFLYRKIKDLFAKGAK